MAKKYKKYKTHQGMDNRIKKIYDIDTVGHMMIKHFFDGSLGKILLDDDILHAKAVSSQSLDQQLLAYQEK